MASVSLLVYWVDLDIDAFIQVFGFFHDIATHFSEWIKGQLGL